MAPERSSQDIEVDFGQFDEVMQPVLLAYPDLDTTNAKQFRKLFCRAMKKLEKARTAKYREREKEDRRLQQQVRG